MRTKRLLALTLTGLLFFTTGCSQMQFIATGKEFKSICEDNGLTVTDITDALSTGKGYTSLNSAYTAVPDDGAFTVNYASFSSSKEAESYYSSIADQMDGAEYTGTNYKAEVETVGDTVREIYMESGRIVYAQGDRKEVNETDTKLMSGWSKPGKVTDAAAEEAEETRAAQSDAAAASDTSKDKAFTSSDTSKDKEATSATGTDTGVSEDTTVTVVDPES